MDRNNTSFPLKVYEYLKSRKWDPKRGGLMYHQFLTLEYLMFNPRQRGILAFHGTGTGKTKLGSAVMVNLARKFSRLRKTLLLAPKSVHAQFADEFKRMGHEGKVSYVSLRASNMATQIERLDAMPGVESWSGSLDDTFVIGDEIHGLLNSICNGSKNAVDFYDMIMDAKGVKLLFLSGSPITNDPFELAPGYNMLAGFKLFGESKEDFDKYFIKDGHINNRDKFMNRILGLTSYYGEMVQPPAMLEKMPQILPQKILHIPMSESQYAIYSVNRDKEREEAKKPSRKIKAERFAPRSSSSTYRIGSRKASNLIPLNAATDAQLQDPKSCPKFHYLLDSIIPSHKNQTGIVLSSFVHDCGLQDVGRLMILRGWERWEEGMDAIPGVRRFAVISGDETLAEREAARKAFNRKDNKNGAVIQVLLVGPAAVEGMNLKNGRWAVQMDPFFNETRLEQGRSRIRRMLSHEDLPPEDRNVQFYILLSDYPKDVYKKGMEPTTDIYMFARARENRILHKEFFTAMIESSIDCMIHKDRLPADRAFELKCMLCSPTNTPLWSSKIEHDIESESPCKPPKQETITAKELIVDTPDGQVKYMYRNVDGGYEFYAFDKLVGGYVKLARNHPHFDLLVDSLDRAS